MRGGGGGDVWGALPALQHGEGEGQFFFGGSGTRTRGRGLAADIEKIGAGALHGERMFDGGWRVEEFATVGKAVGRDIEDAHDEGALAETQGSRGQFKLKMLSLGHWSEAV